MRRRLPPDRAGLAKTFRVPRADGEPMTVYVVVNTYEDGAPGEMFVYGERMGELEHGLLDQWATMASIALQHGAPITTLVDKMVGQRFNPAGITTDPQYRTVSSVVDYIGRWLRDSFVPQEVAA